MALTDNLKMMETYKNCLRTVERMIDDVLEDGLERGDQWVAGLERDVVRELETCRLYNRKVKEVTYDEGGFEDADVAWAQWRQDLLETDGLYSKVRFRARSVFRVWQRVERYNKLVNVFFELEDI